MFQDMLKISRCNKPTNRLVMPLAGIAAVLEPWIAAEAAGKFTGQFADDFPPLSPSGMILHEMRVGSTLLANMLAAPKTALVYSESPPPLDVLRSGAMPPDERARALKVVLAAMTRVRGYSGLYLKFQMVTSPSYVRMLWETFPKTPWVYLFRRPEDVMVSMFRMQGARPLPKDVDPPCTRTQKKRPEPQVRAILAGNGTEPRVASKKQYCAAYVANLNDVPIAAAASMKQDGIPVPPGWHVHYNSLKPMAFTIMQDLFGLQLDDTAKDLVNATAGLYSKSRMQFGKEQEFGTDNARKTEVLTAEVVFWSRMYMYPQYAALLDLALSAPGLSAEQSDYLKSEHAWLKEGGNSHLIQDEAYWDSLIAKRKQRFKASESTVPLDRVGVKEAVGNIPKPAAGKGEGKPPPTKPTAKVVKDKSKPADASGTKQAEGRESASAADPLAQAKAAAVAAEKAAQDAAVALKLAEEAAKKKPSPAKAPATQTPGSKAKAEPEESEAKAEPEAKEPEAKAEPEESEAKAEPEAKEPEAKAEPEAKSAT